MQEKTALDVKFKDLSRLKNHRSDYSTILGRLLAEISLFVSTQLAHAG